MSIRVISRTTGAAIIGALLAACHGGGGGSVVPATHQSGGGSIAAQPYTGPASLAFKWGEAILRRNATYLGAAKTSGRMSLEVIPQLQNEPGLLEYAQSTAEPRSGNYRHWLTPTEIGSMFGASSSTLAAAARYFSSYHLASGTWPQHLMMIVTGTQANIEAAFGTKFGMWLLTTPAGPIKVYGPQPSTPPHFSRPIPVVAVTGLVGFHPAHTYIERPADVEGFGYTAPVIRNGFDYTGLIAAGDNGKGINIGVIGTGPISPADVPQYAKLSGTSEYASVVQKDVTSQPADSQNDDTGSCYFGDPCSNGVDTGLATPPPATGTSATCTSAYTADPSTTCNPEDGEAQLDTEMSAGMAPGATVDFYLAFNNQDCTAYPGTCQSDSIGVEGIYLTDDEIQQAIADNIADVLSLSFGGGEPGYESAGYFNSTGIGVGPDEFAALAAEGVTVFVSSGDDGAYECDNGTYPETTKCASYPATDPSVVAVGGVNAPLTNSGQLQPGTEISAWANNTTYGGDGYADNSPGSGGGPSQYFKAPSWQSAPAIGATYRETPDIALLADPGTGPLLVVNAAFGSSGGYAYGASGGTSAAAPLAAAMFADFLTACKANATCSSAHSFGSHGYRWGIAAANAFYTIAENEAGSNFGKQVECAGGVSGAFYDVCAGSNDVTVASPSPAAVYPGFPSVPGYNEVTGLGVPFGGYLANAMFADCSCGTPNLP